MTLKLWDLATGKELRTFAGPGYSIFSVAISPDGRTAFSGNTDGKLKLWELATGKELRTFTGHAYNGSPVAFFPDGRTAISGSGYMLELWRPDALPPLVHHPLTPPGSRNGTGGRRRKADFQ